MERKSSKEYSVVFLVESKKFKLLDLPSTTSSLLSVLLRIRSAQRLISQYFAAVPTPNIAELVPSGFFCPQPWILRRSEHIFPEKTSACLVNRTAINKQQLKYNNKQSFTKWQVGRLVRTYNPGH